MISRLRLDSTRTQPVLLQGDRGFSRKARRRRRELLLQPPAPEVSGEITVDGRRRT